MIRNIMGIHSSDSLVVHFFTGPFPNLRFGLKKKLKEINVFLLERKNRKPLLLEGFEIFFKKLVLKKKRK